MHSRSCIRERVCFEFSFLLFDARFRAAATSSHSCVLKFLVSGCGLPVYVHASALGGRACHGRRSAPRASRRWYACSPEGEAHREGLGVVERQEVFLRLGRSRGLALSPKHASLVLLLSCSFLVMVFSRSRASRLDVSEFDLLSKAAALIFFQCRDHGLLLSSFQSVIL